MTISPNRLRQGSGMLYGPDRQGGDRHRIICTTILNEYREIRLAVVRRMLEPWGESPPGRRPALHAASHIS